MTCRCGDRQCPGEWWMLHPNGQWLQITHAEYLQIVWGFRRLVPAPERVVACFEAGAPSRADRRQARR